ncbi:hypothetical protein LCGC14_1032050 [marine sediment metagenome]|uniref:Uncharacterized protein n=1 Tax=marine sediment metagenome TaxID=412755 RepID=A0A0F9QCF2_9ZZZZ
MRVSLVVQHVAFTLLVLFPLYILFAVRGLDPLVYLVGVPVFWAALGVIAALFNRNFEEE